MHQMQERGTTIAANKTYPFNTLMTTQNGRHFADDVFKCIFLMKKVLSSISIH